MEFLNFLSSLVGDAGGIVPYAIVFGVLLTCGLGVPLPEDISLIFGGFLVFEERAVLPWMMLTGYLGIIIGDSMIFFFGRKFGSKLGSKPTGFFSRVISPDKRARVEGLFKKHGEKIVLLARFLPGVRSVTYFTAGSVGMKYSHFVFFDSVASLASAPIFVFLGFKFGGELEELLHKIARGQRSVVIATVVILLAGFLFSRWRSKREAQANAEALRQKELEAQQAPKVG